MKPDFLIFCSLALGLFGLLHLFWWRKCFGFAHALAWAGMVIVLPVAWWMVERAETSERKHLTEPLMGFAPTYAGEMARMGHARITKDTPATDPQYLKLIEVQKDWLRANPRAASIYTFRLDPGWKYASKAGEPVHFVVCAEVDYDKNGEYNGAEEERVPIWDKYTDTTDSLFEVFQGKQSFEDEPVHDFWGAWVTAYAPVFGPDGKVEAAVGVDFDAREWLAALSRARSTMLAYFGLVLLMLAGGVSVASNQMLMQAARKEREVAEVTRAAKEKFENLVNSIEGVVFEWNPAEGSFAFLSPQASRILGQPAEYWLERGRWEQSLHADDRDAACGSREGAARARGAYMAEYRMTGPEGRLIWVRETGNLARDAEGGPLLLRGILADITPQKRAAEELEKTHRQLVDTSRRAGMAEVATGVLHNVGNVLNSVNVASSLIRQRLNNSRLGSLGQLADMLKAKGAGLGAFFQTDPRGKVVPEYLATLATHLRGEQQAVLAEVEKLGKNIEHIKTIVDLQQNYARSGGATEPVEVAALVDDALGINAASLSRHRIRVVKQFAEGLPPAFADRNKMLQILVNLIRNAKHAVDEANGEQRMIGIAVQRHGLERVRIIVADTGVGIAPENMARLFSHGFTTRKNGHGFGLHSSEAAAREMGGSLTAHSDGPGRGAVFTLELPLHKAKPVGEVQPVAQQGASPFTMLPAMPEAVEPPPVAQSPFTVAADPAPAVSPPAIPGAIPPATVLAAVAAGVPASHVMPPLPAVPEVALPTVALPETPPLPTAPSPEPPSASGWHLPGSEPDLSPAEKAMSQLPWNTVTSARNAPAAPETGATTVRERSLPVMTTALPPPVKPPAQDLPWNAPPAKPPPTKLQHAAV